MHLVNGANSNVIQGNLIGVNAAGAAALPNASEGIFFEDSTGSVGGNTLAARNVISGNGGNGISIDDDSSNVGISGNYIGTNQAGTAAIPNGASGVLVQGTNHGIGSNSVADGNLISGNTLAGIFFNSAQLVDVRNNQIGTNAAGTGAIPNGAEGVRVNSSSRLAIGNVQSGGSGNTIAFNTSQGVSVSADSERIGIVDNRIFSNGGLGIDLLPLGVNANDQGDGDGGANNGQNFPVILTAISEGTLTVTGAINTNPNTNNVRIQVFSSSTCDPSGYGEGQRFLGEVGVNTDASGNANWQVAGLPAPGAGAIITATASATTGFNVHTSEFSACFTATGAPAVVPSPTPDPTDPTDPANANGNAVGQPKNEKPDDVKETDDQKRQRERTNRGGTDDYRTEGNVVAVDLDAKPRTATIATRDGLQVIVLLCRDDCDDPKVGDYLEAEGEKENEALFYADSVTSRRSGR